MPTPEHLPFGQGLVACFCWQLVSGHLAWFPPIASYGLLMPLAHSMAWALSVPQWHSAYYGIEQYWDNEAIDSSSTVPSAGTAWRWQAAPVAQQNGIFTAYV